jgi:hypothetical protein
MGQIIGVLAAVVGLVSVFFVMRHRSVQTKSMYSLRRGQIEHKVRAARQRTLGPQKRPAEANAMTPTGGPAGPVEIVTDVAPAYAPPPGEPPASPSRHVWDIGPTAPAPAPPQAARPPSPPPPPVFAPLDPPTEQLPPEPAWNPTPAGMDQAPAGAAAGGEAGWEVVGEPGESSAPASGGRGKSRKAAGAGWEIVGGPNVDEASDRGKGPSAVLAVAQYVVLVLGLMIVLFGVLVIIANSNSG